MNRWREVLCTTPMRLTLRLVVLFVAISLVAFGATWWLANNALIDATETTLQQQIDALSASDRPEEIARAVRNAAKQADAEHLILRYDGPQGAVGNYLGPLPAEDLAKVSLHDHDHDIKGDYFLMREKVAGGTLTAGQDADAFDDLGEVFLQVLTLTLLPTALLVLGGGLIFAFRSARRIAAIEDTLERLSAGELSARLPELPGTPDDLTRVGAGIDRLAAAQEASVSALRQVSADIAHDLKTPIQRLMVLLDQARDQAPEVEVLDRAAAEAHGIVATFQALLQIAQIEGGSPRARFMPVDLGPLAQTMTELYEPAATETGHSLTLSLRQPATINGERTLLGQVIANLIENALRHSPPGPVALTIDGATITVADHGPGIPASEHQAVLRRLYRLESSRSTPGSGLGLALVDVIVKLHGGTLSLQDNAPGLRAVVTFPGMTG